MRTRDSERDSLSLIGTQHLVLAMRDCAYWDCCVEFLCACGCRRARNVLAGFSTTQPGESRTFATERGSIAHSSKCSLSVSAVRPKTFKRTPGQTSQQTPVNTTQTINSCSNMTTRSSFQAKPCNARISVKEGIRM